jgi:hypothetical protein
MSKFLFDLLFSDNALAGALLWGFAAFVFLFAMGNADQLIEVAK